MGKVKNEMLERLAKEEEIFQNAYVADMPELDEYRCEIEYFTDAYKGLARTLDEFFEEYEIVSAFAKEKGFDFGVLDDQDLVEYIEKIGDIFE